MQEIIKQLYSLNFDDLKIAIQYCPVSIQKQLQEHFKKDPVAWIDLCAYAYDPECERLDKLRKYRLFDKQKEYVLELFKHIDGKCKPVQLVYEKSRRIGWTNTTLMFLTYVAIYHNASSIIAAQDEAITDTLGDEANSLLPRIRRVIDELPYWMMKDIEYKSQHCNININKATIKGTATGSKHSSSKAGRGGRTQYALLDECGFWDSMSLELAANALAPTSKCRILISSAAETNTHYFSQLVDDLKAKDPVKHAFISHTINPANTEQWLEGLRDGMSPSKFLQEVYGNRGGSDAKIMRNTQEATYYIPEAKRKEGEKFWHKDNTIIKDWMREQGKIVIGWDGGRNANFSACTISYKLNKNDRWIILKEFSNEKPGGELSQVIEMSEKYIRENLAGYKIEDYGDPVMISDSDTFRAETRRDINCLEHLRKPDNNLTDFVKMKYTAAFQSRMLKRLNHTDWILSRRLSDGYPQVIVLDECENIRQGFHDGSYQWEVKHGEVNRNEIHQNHPLVDICDSFTYAILATYPLLPSDTVNRSQAGTIYR